MADRMFVPSEASLTPGIVRLYGMWAFDNSAPDGEFMQDSVHADGFTINKYNEVSDIHIITLDDLYMAYLGMRITFVDNAVNAARGNEIFVQHPVGVTPAGTTLGEAVSDGSRQITFGYYGANGAANPRLRNVTLHCEIILKNSDIPWTIRQSS